MVLHGQRAEVGGGGVKGHDKNDIVLVILLWKKIRKNI